MSSPARILLQSHSPDPPLWVQRCLESVRAFAVTHGYTYRLLDDAALFEGVPGAYLRTCRAHGRMATAADLGRLLRAREALASGATRVVWLDADMLIFDAVRLATDLEAMARAHLHAFGVEIWVQPGPKPGRSARGAAKHPQRRLPVPAWYSGPGFSHPCLRTIGGAVGARKRVPATTMRAASVERAGPTGAVSLAGKLRHGQSACWARRDRPRRRAGVDVVSAAVKGHGAAGCGQPLFIVG